MIRILKKGMKVRHKAKPEWGDGEIVSVARGGAVTIQFEKGDECTIVSGNKFLIPVGAEAKSEKRTGEFKKGDRFRHKKHPEWGIGEVLEDSNGEFVKVFSANVGEKILYNNPEAFEVVTGEDAANPILDNLSYRTLGKEKKVNFYTPERGIKKFLEVFPDGFVDEKYLENERYYKVDAHDLMVDLLGEDEIRNLLEERSFSKICSRALKVVNKTNLIFPNEKMSLKDGLTTSTNQEVFAIELNNLLYGNSLQKDFISFSDFLSEIEAAKWTIVSYFLFIAKPKNFMFLKPTVTQHAAEMMRFEINYQPALNWNTYNSVLKLSDLLRDKLIEADLNPRDMIDVQSFMWAITAY